jgi:hypothetical protein
MRTIVLSLFLVSAGAVSLVPGATAGGHSQAVCLPQIGEYGPRFCVYVQGPLSNPDYILIMTWMCSQDGCPDYSQEPTSSTCVPATKPCP